LGRQLKGQVDEWSIILPLVIGTPLDKWGAQVDQLPKQNKAVENFFFHSAMKVLALQHSGYISDFEN